MTTSKNRNLITLLVSLLVIVVAVQGVFLAKLYRQSPAHEAEINSKPVRMQLLPKTGNSPPTGSGSGSGLPSPQSVAPFGGFDPDAWDPFHEFRNMRQQMDQMFNNSFGRFRQAPDFQSLWSGTTFSPSMDMEEKKDRYIIRMDIPGADKSNISVDIDDRKLTVSGKVDETVEEQGKNTLRRERRRGEFTRSIQLPGPVKSDEMNAEYKNGVLVITLPKEKTEGSKRNIEVTTGITKERIV